MEEKAVDAKAVAAKFEIGVQTVYDLANRPINPMPHGRFGAAYRFMLSEVDAWSRGQKLPGKPTVRRAPEPKHQSERKSKPKGSGLELRGANVQAVD